MKRFLLFLNLSVLVTNVASLGLKVQPQTIVDSPTLVLWTREDSDLSSMTFDLRFVQGNADVGLAAANLELGEDDDFGSASVTFPAQGQYVLKAVTGSPPNILVGTSKQILAVGLNTPPTSASASASGSAATLAPTAPPSSTSATNTASSSSTPTPTSHPTSNPSQPSASTMPTSTLAKLKRNPNIPAIVGGLIGGILILALLAILFIMLSRRRRAFKRRLTFHKDMMVQPRMMIQPRLDLPSLGLPSESHDSAGSTATPTATPAPTTEAHGHDGDFDVEQGLASAVPRPLGSGHVVPSPKGPRPSIKRATATRTVTVITPRTPNEPMPLRTRRQKQLADRIKMLQGQMEDVQQQNAYSGVEGEEAGRRDSVHVLEEMQREMVWLRDHEQSAWAMGLTDVLPPGHARYMTP